MVRQATAPATPSLDARNNNHYSNKGTPRAKQCGEEKKYSFLLAKRRKMKIENFFFSFEASQNENFISSGEPVFELGSVNSTETPLARDGQTVLLRMATPE